MKTIYADFNSIDAEGTLWLAGRGSLESIAALTEPLIEGEVVWLTDHEIGVEARVFQLPDGSWEARSDWQFVDEPTPEAPSG